MNKNCPSCGASYGIGPQNVGRRLPCKKCGTALVVGSDGLQLAHAQTPNPSSDIAAHEEPTLYGGDVMPQTGFGRSVKALPTDMLLGLVAKICFGFGMFLVILFLFFPLMDLARADGIKAEISAGNNKVAFKGIPQGGPNEGEDSKRKDWEKAREKLDKNLEEVHIASHRSRYWNLWGMMIGFFFLAGSSLSFLHPRNTTATKVVGAVILCAQAVLIFTAFVIGGTAAGFR